MSETTPNNSVALTKPPLKPSIRHYQDLYNQNSEPWNYDSRAQEILRHDTFISLLKNLKPKFNNVLDIGCSLGQLTKKLSTISEQIIGFDVSTTAIKKAMVNCRGYSSHFLVAGLPEIPFKNSTFDLIVIADCINEFVPDDKKEFTLSEISHCLKEGGYVLFSDYIKVNRFTSFIQLVGSHFTIVEVHYLNDRLWYQFESWFKAIRHWNWVKNLLSSIMIAKILNYSAKLFGKYGTRHIVILAQKAKHHP